MGMRVEAPRVDARTALLDAVEGILIDEGHAAATTRAVATRAGVNHGLVHYYFGTVDDLMFAALDRVTTRLQARQEALYATDGPFLPKWREAMRHLVQDDHGYAKLWLELQARAWNRPEHRVHLHRVATGWRRVLADAIEAATREYGIDTHACPVEALTTLVMTFNLGIQVEATTGIHEGHDALLAMIDRLLADLHDRAHEEGSP